MNSLFKLILSLSVSGSLLILTLLLCKPLVQHRLSKRWQYYIWLVVIARLLLPFTPPVSAVGLLFTQAELRTAPQISAVQAAAPLPDEEALAISTSPAPSSPPAAGDAHKSPPSMLSHLGLLWLAVAAGLLLRKITIYQSFINYLRASCEEVSDIALLDRLAQLSAQAGVKRPLELSINPLISSPLLYGFFCPCIVLPTASLPDADFQYTILHELTHYKRRDLFYKWLVQLVLCVHWFNPLVYWMNREISRVCELSCDEAVLQTLDTAQRRVYGDTLLHAMGNGGTYKSAPASVMLNESAALLKERLNAIMKFHKISRTAAILSVVFAILLTVGATVAGAYTGLPVTRPAAMKNWIYTREAFYQPPYLFEIGWNVKQESISGTYASTNLTLPDGRVMNVLFDDGCKSYQNDPAALEALTNLLARLRMEKASSEHPVEWPLVFYVGYIGDSKPDALTAEYYYENGSIAQFAAVFAQLDSSSQRRYLDQIYQDQRLDFFNVSLKQLKPDDPLFMYYAQKAYDDKNLTFFSIAAESMSAKQLNQFLDLAAQDQRINFQSVLLNKLGKERELEALKIVQENRRDEEYRALGITHEGTAYYYKGERLSILLDQRENQSLVTLQTDPKGTVALRIQRDKAGTIESVSYMTQAEVDDFFEETPDFDESELEKFAEHAPLDEIWDTTWDFAWDTARDKILSGDWD